MGIYLPFSLPQSSRQTASHSHYCLLTQNKEAPPLPFSKTVRLAPVRQIFSFHFHKAAPTALERNALRDLGLSFAPVVELATSASRAALAAAEACTIGAAVFPLLTALNRAWLPGCTYSNQRLIKLGTD